VIAKNRRKVMTIMKAKTMTVMVIMTIKSIIIQAKQA